MMGFTATQVDEMSLWQLTVQAEAFADAHASKDSAKGLTEDDFESLSDLIDKD